MSTPFTAVLPSIEKLKTELDKLDTATKEIAKAQQSATLNQQAANAVVSAAKEIELAQRKLIQAWDDALQQQVQIAAETTKQHQRSLEQHEDTKRHQALLQAELAQVEVAQQETQATLQSEVQNLTGQLMAMAKQQQLLQWIVAGGLLIIGVVELLIAGRVLQKP